jgi:hypothetical protein
MISSRKGVHCQIRLFYRVNNCDRSASNNCAFVNVEVFKSSRRLLVHAESKINDIDRAINEFLDSDVTLSPEMYEHMYYVVADLKNPILDSIGFQIVETVGHCRAALDKLVADLAK